MREAIRGTSHLINGGTHLLIIVIVYSHRLALLLVLLLILLLILLLVLLLLSISTVPIQAPPDALRRERSCGPCMRTNPSSG